MLLSIDEGKLTDFNQPSLTSSDGRALLINFYRRAVLAYFNFKKPVRDAQFSPDGLWLAVTHGNLVQVWRTPGAKQREFAPFTLYKTYGGHYDQINTIQWSQDSKAFLTASKDMSAKLYTLDATRDEHGNLSKALTLSGHRDGLVGAYWSSDEKTICTISRDGACFVWEIRVVDEDTDTPEDVEQRRQRPWGITARHYFNQNNTYVKSVAFHTQSRILVVGFSTGVFGLWEMPEFNNIHTLSISQRKISSISINPSGEWLAFGAATLGQLLVWEWQSESYVLKQQGHFFDMSKVAYSPDGQYIATGGDDGKVKVWSSSTGFCFVTFTEHSPGSSITGLEFAKHGQVLFSSSLDGTVRAFDLIRYRNFRTFTSPTPVQFASLAVDPSGEVVAAGCHDTFDIYIWSVQTGRLLEILSGHEGPVCALAFAPSGSNLLASGSWDYSVRLWDAFARSESNVGDPLRHTSEVISLAFRPDGNEIAASTLDGNISFWNPAEGSQKGLSIDGRRDVSGGRKLDDRMTAANSSSGKSFSSLVYTAEGQHIIAGGNSKYVCVYDCQGGVLVRRFSISENTSLDGTREFLNSKNLTDAGPLELIDDDEGSDNDLMDRLDSSLPGTAKGDLSKRRTRPEARVRDIRFSPTGRSWAAATTEGLLIYSLDSSFDMTFDPLDLDIDITASSVMALLQEASEKSSYLVPLVSALRLSELSVIQKVFDAIPPSQVRLVAQNLPRKYVLPLMRHLVTWWSDSEGGRAAAAASPHVEFNLLWLRELLASHGEWMRSQAGARGSIAMGPGEDDVVLNRTTNTGGLDVKAVLRGVQRGVNNVRDQVSKLCDDNTYTLRYLIEASNSDPMDVDGQNE